MNITALAKEEGFIVETDRLTGITKLYELKNGLEIESIIEREKAIEAAKAQLKK